MQRKTKKIVANGIEVTLAARGSRYGDFNEKARITQALKNTMQDSPNWNELPPEQKEALEMVVHKIGRILNGDNNYKDSWIDIEGYIHLVSQELEED